MMPYVVYMPTAQNLCCGNEAGADAVAVARISAFRLTKSKH